MNIYVGNLSGDVTEQYRTLDTFMQKRKLNHINLPLMTEADPPRQKVDEFLKEIADTNNWPILVHCGAGVDRTGMMIALHRMVNDGWQWNRAREEALDHGFHHENKEKQEILETMPELASDIIASNKFTLTMQL